MSKINHLQMNQLNEEQVNDIRKLEQICQQTDGLKGTVFLSNEINFDESINSFYLLYNGARLISFVSMFIPTPTEAEISAYTLPECRKRGHFQSLLKEVTAELQKYGICKILFVHEPTSTDAKSVLRLLRSQYVFTEYLLVYNPVSFTKCSSNLCLKRASSESIPKMAALDSALFKNDYEESLSLVTKSLQSEDIKSYAAFLDDKLIGLCNLNIEGGNTSIFGIGIAPDYQGRGYGKEMLNLLLEQMICSEHGEITLEVNSKNDIAYHLYIKSGFQIKTQFDYYSYLLENNG